MKGEDNKNNKKYVYALFSNRGVFIESEFSGDIKDYWFKLSKNKRRKYAPVRREIDSNGNYVSKRWEVLNSWPPPQNIIGKK